MFIPKKADPQLPTSLANKPTTQSAFPLAASAIRATCTCLSTPLLDGRGGIVCASCRAPLVAHVAATPRPYSQRDGERPVGAGRVLYLREHRALVRNRDKGAWSEGRARLMSHEAWSRAMAKHAPALAAPAPRAADSGDLDDVTLAEIGLVRRRA